MLMRAEFSSGEIYTPSHATNETASTPNIVRKKQSNLEDLQNCKYSHFSINVTGVPKSLKSPFSSFLLCLFAFCATALYLQQSFLSKLWAPVAGFPGAWTPPVAAWVIGILDAFLLSFWAIWWQHCAVWKWKLILHPLTFCTNTGTCQVRESSHLPCNRHGLHWGD